MIKSHWSLSELSESFDIPRRTLRFYIQSELLDPPVGAGRGAHYTQTHVDQLTRIKALTASGLSLEAVKSQMKPEPSVIPPRPSASGQVSVLTHVLVADGVELVIDASRADLSPSELKTLFNQTIEAYRRIKESDS